MTVLASPQLLIGGANVLAGVGELSRASGGPVVDKLLRQVSHTGEGGWSAAFVYHVGYWSHYDYATRTSAWPLPALADADAVHRFAVENDIVREEPAANDLFTLYSPLRRCFIRTGIILSVGESSVLPSGSRYHECITLEGDTNEDGEAAGNSTRRARRYLSHADGDRFIRWMDLALGQHRRAA